MTRRGILTGGTWCVDHNKLVDFWPGEDGLTEIRSMTLGGGGSGHNLAVDIRKLDPSLPVATIGLVGDDEDGRFLLAEADKHGIERSQLALTAEAPTHYTDAFTSRRSGRRTHIFYRGTGALLAPHHFDFAGRNERILHLGLPGVHPLMDGPWQGEASGWVATLKKARAAGLQTNLELASFAPEVIAALVRPCLPHLDLLVVNDVEIGAIAGTSLVSDGHTDVAGCIQAAQAVLKQGAMQVVVAHFPMGAVAVTRDGGSTVVPSLNVPLAEVVGTNGAGDAFAAGFVYGFHEGWPLAECLALAHATAGASLRGVGTTDGVVPWRECLALAGRWGRRAVPG
jgi:sugar/nucleoside kinase (ribokinase family)